MPPCIDVRRGWWARCRHCPYLPGGHLYIHRGALEAIVFMVNTPSFVVGEIPGAIEDAVRLSLAAELAEIGFLELPGS